MRYFITKNGKEPTSMKDVLWVVSGTVDIESYKKRLEKIVNAVRDGKELKDRFYYSAADTIRKWLTQGFIPKMYIP